MKQKNIKKILFVLFIVFFIGINVVSAASKTSAELHFCQYAGVRRTFKIIGYAIIIIKILVPLLLMYFVIYDVFKAMIGKEGDLKNAVPVILKRLIASFVIFITPTIINGVFAILGYDDEGSAAQCIQCTFDVDKCKVEDGDNDDQTAMNIIKKD